MTMLQRLTKTLATPAHLTHELLHVLAALPWAERIRLEIAPLQGATHRVRWQEGTPRWAIAAAALAPLIGGVLALGVALWALATGMVAAPTDATEWALWAILGAYVAMAAKPSAADLQAATDTPGDTHD